jgi:hypothetical protein
MVPLNKKAGESDTLLGNRQVSIDHLCNEESNFIRDKELYHPWSS